MVLRTRMWSAGRFFLLGGGLLATYLIFAIASMRLALRATEVRVPDLTNHTANEATTMASGLGLTIRVDDNRRPDPKVLVDHVLTQDPAPGSTARRQRSIKVWLSAGQHAATVPALVGESERRAQLRLASDYPSDVVVAQDPAPSGTGASVMLLVNREEHGANYVMPDLIGVNGDRASDVLRGHGFRVALVGSTPYPGVAAGIVVRQSPQAGFQIAPGEPISLEVSR